jgi:hypothetical protein
MFGYAGNTASNTSDIQLTRPGDAKLDGNTNFNWPEQGTVSMLSMGAEISLGRPRRQPT